MKKHESEQHEIDGLIDKINDHLAGSKTLSSFTLASLRLKPMGQGATHMCVSPRGIKIELPADTSCPPGFQDLGEP